MSVIGCDHYDNDDGGDVEVVVVVNMMVVDMVEVEVVMEKVVVVVDEVEVEVEEVV